MSIPVTYIVAAPYSGSTLLTLLLATHPAIGTVGERGHFHRKILAKRQIGSPTCSCGRSFVNCPYWQRVRQALEQSVRARWLRQPFSAFQVVRRPRLARRLLNRLCLRYAVADELVRLPSPLRTRFQGLQAANAALVATVLAQSRTSHFLDASKIVEHAIFLHRTPGLKVRAIHLLRDGRAQVHSTLRHHPERDAAHAGRRWRQLVARSTALLAQAAIPTHTVRYEALCAAPRETLAAVYDFIGLDAGRGSLNFRHEEQHIMGNPMRLGSGAAIVDQQRWRHEMTAPALASFERAAGDFNRAIGYGK